MVVIRLARFGSKKRPKYRITVADSRRHATGKFIEILGNYNPAPQGTEKAVILDEERYKYWVANGAQPTKRVKSVVSQKPA
tara:strand:- start:1050 stop:1292 length:243 start_codon:yes stop_codon:yes gene_type:complete